MAFIHAYHTDVGIKKKTNQDAMLVKTAKTPNGYVGMFVVCDGMGGLDHGELASATVVRGLSDWFEQELPDLLHSSQQDVDIREALEACILSQNEKILDYGDETNTQVGTTVTALLIIHSRYYIVHIGDSRAYQIQNQVTRLTRDQTLVAREVERGNITPEQALKDPRRNVLLQCVGATKELEVVILTGEAEPGTVFLLCTDGFYHKITDAELLEELRPNPFLNEKQLKYKAIKLIDAVKERKEVDNISIVLAHVV
ncbi:protein phosphatase 2C domain-containing protein [Bacillus sp. JJ1566]|uniref:PP2C family protein-serine/threonine phosphatase n=1 Tax=Bacillus sp. JJ1566 TaxID=3122961 RepID=UPI002FFE21A9